MSAKHTERASYWSEKSGNFSGKYAESGRPGSNRRQPAWEASALPTELRPQLNKTLLEIAENPNHTIK